MKHCPELIQNSKNRILLFIYSKFISLTRASNFYIKIIFIFIFISLVSHIFSTETYYYLINSFERKSFYFPVQSETLTDIRLMFDAC